MGLMGLYVAWKRFLFSCCFKAPVGKSLALGKRGLNSPFNVHGCVGVSARLHAFFKAESTQTEKRQIINSFAIFQL